MYKKGKKTILLLSIFVMLSMFSITTIASTNGTCGHALLWSLQDNGTLVISGTGKMTQFVSVADAPWYACRDDIKYIEIRRGVTTVSPNAFYGCERVIGVSIADSVTEIGSSAFYGCISLKKVALPLNLKDVESYTFANCINLESVLIQNGVSSIGVGAFSGCNSLVSINVPESVSVIGNNAFSGCKALRGITITDNVEQLGYAAFMCCENLQSANIPKGLTEIQSRTFFGCAKLNNITIPGNVTIIGTEAFAGCTSLQSVTIPEKVTNIGNRTFSGCRSLCEVDFNAVECTYMGNESGLVFEKCTYLTDIDIGEGVKVIPAYAFKNLSDLMMVAIPDSTKTIGDEAFYGCSKLNLLNLGNGVKSIGRRAFFECKSLGEVEFPNSVITIGEEAFWGCIYITKVTFGNKLTNIGDGAFSMCSNLKNLEIPTTVTHIGNGAFQNCYTLSEIILCQGLKVIGNSAFSGCTSLKSISIPNTVTHIGNAAFSNCIKFTDVIVPDSVVSIGKGAFYGCTGLEEITIPFVGSSSAGLNNSDGVFGFIFGYFVKTDNTPPNGTTYQFKNAGYYYFYYIPESLKKVTVTGNCSLSDNAFLNCTNIKELAFLGTISGGSFDSLYGSAYYENEENWENDCLYFEDWLVATRNESVTELSVREGIVGIGRRALSTLVNLVTVNLPSSLQKVDKGAFSACEKLLKVSFSGTCQEWDNITIEANNKPLTTLSIQCSDGETDIILERGTCGTDVKYKLNDQGVLTISGSGKMRTFSSWDNAPWYGKRADIKEVVISDGVISISEWAFYNYSGITEVTIPASVEEIGNRAFAYCTGIKTITFNAKNCTYAGGMPAFGDSTLLATLNIGADVVHIPDNLFLNCTNITDIYFAGTVEDWKNVVIGENNTPIINPDKQCSDGVVMTLVKTGSCGEGVIYNEYFSGVIVISGNGTMADTGMPWSDYAETIKEIIIEDGVTHIGKQAFKDCEKLESIIIPDSVTSIGERAFCRCIGLTSIEIPENVATLGAYIFEGCTNLGTLYFNAEECVYDSEYGVAGSIFGETSLTDIIIGDKVKDIPVVAFKGLNGITQVELPNELMGIGEYAFANCINLADISIPAGVTSIQSGTFMGCTALENIIIPESITSIGKYAFYGCSSIETITVPQNITVIGESAFSECSNLLTLYFNAKDCTFDGREYGWENIFGTSPVLESVIIGDEVERIFDHAFEGCTKLKSVLLPESVKDIGASAFYGCSNLENINIPEGVETIGESAFYNCERVIDICIPATVTYIGDAAFWGSGLKQVTLNAANCSYMGSVTKSVFSGCPYLVTIIIGEQVQAIPSYAFFNCNHIKSINIPENVMKIGEYAFHSCYNLLCVTIPDNVTEISSNAFDKQSQGCAVYIYSDDDAYAKEYTANVTDPLVRWKNISELEVEARINEVSEKDGILTVSFYTDQKSWFPVGTVRVSAYNDDGILCIIPKQLLIPNETEYRFDVSSIPNGATIKVFAWETEKTLVPICKMEQKIY